MIFSILIRFLLYTLVILFLTLSFILLEGYGSDGYVQSFFSLMCATSSFFVLQLGHETYSLRYPATRISALSSKKRIALIAFLTIYAFIVANNYYGYFETVGLRPLTDAITINW